MSGVSPSASDHRYIGQMISDIKQQAADAEATKKEEIERNDARSAEEIERLEERQKENLEEVEEEYSETVDSIRENSEETNEKTKKKAREEIQELRRNSYDRFGKLRDEELDQIRGRYQKAEADLEMRAKRLEDAIEANEERHAERVENLHREHQRDLENSSKTSRDSAFKAYRKAYGDEKKAHQDFQSNLEDHYNSLNRDRISELNFLKEREHALDEYKRAVDHEVRKNSDARANKIAALQGEIEQAEREAILAERRRYDSEVRDLKEQIDLLSESQKRYADGFAQGRDEAIEELEQDVSLRNQEIERTHKAEMDKIRYEKDRLEGRFAAKNTQNLIEQANEFQKVISGKEADHLQTQQDLQSFFEGNVEQIKQQRENEQIASERRFEGNIDKMRSTHTEALQRQAESFRESMRRREGALLSEIETLETENNEHKTTADPSKISPVAEGKIRDQVTEQYQQLFTEARERHDTSTRNLKKKYADAMNDFLAEHNREKRMLTAERSGAELDGDRRLANYVEESNFAFRESQEKLEREHRKVLEGMEKNFMNALEDQRLQYEEIIKTNRLNTTTELKSIREEYAFQERMNQREFAAQKNELIRNFEQQLETQREEFENHIDIKRKETERQVLDLERDKRAALEEQARAYDHQMKQVEFQNKERQRYMAQSYEEQLENVRRTNARLIAKKS